jgi:UDP-N-acetylmuramate-alanine ligase
MRVPSIAFCGAVMQTLTITLHKKGYSVIGSDGKTKEMWMKSLFETIMRFQRYYFYIRNLKRKLIN